MASTLLGVVCIFSLLVLILPFIHNIIMLAVRVTNVKYFCDFYYIITFITFLHIYIVT